MIFERSSRKCIQKYKLYDKEITKYKHLYHSFISIKEACEIIRILCDKFKIKPNKIEFNYNNEMHGGWANRNGDIGFKKETLNILIVCHELCHLYSFKQKVYTHSYNFYKNLDKITKFIECNLTFKMKELK